MATIVFCTGFGIGTTAGWITGGTTERYGSAVVATPTIVTSGFTDIYALEVSASAALESFRFDSTIVGAGTINVGSVRIKLVTLPGADCDIFDVMASGTGDDMVFGFSSADTAFSMKVGVSGTPTIASFDVVADTWYRLDWRYNCTASPITIDWQLDGIPQGSVSQAVTVGTITNVACGSVQTATTFTARYDDLVVSNTSSDYPLGPHKVKLLNIDTSTAYVLSGTAGNWSTFTANGTLDSTFTVTEARDNSDEWPPTIGSSADGWCQDTAATSDYLEMAFNSYQLQPGEEIVALRTLICGWAASTTAATIGFRSWNGATETNFFPAADPAFDNSTTVPAWVCRMLTLGNFDTQAELDALAIRGGFSGDASPVIGIHAIAIEVAIKENTRPHLVMPRW